MMMDALALLKSVQKQNPNPILENSNGLRLLEVLDKMFLLKQGHKQATVLSYKNTIKEFSDFLINPYICSVMVSDVTRYQEFLAATKKNTSRTLDNKVATIRSLFNFAIERAYFQGKNPAEQKALVSKMEKARTGYAIFEKEEIKRIFAPELMEEIREDDPDYYWCLMLGLTTGCRISEITSLHSNQILESVRGFSYLKIREAKTLAGEREIPLPNYLMKNGFEDFIGNKKKIFKYVERLGKGSGNAVSQKFKRHMEKVGVKRPKLVFHSLRKYLNDCLLAADVSFENRCQFIGHDIENVNVATYTKKISLEKIAEAIGPVQQKILIDIGFFRTKF